MFVGKDVPTALGYAKPQNAIAMHVDEDDSLKWGLIDSKGIQQHVDNDVKTTVAICDTGSEESAGTELLITS